jgi:hypothetical protein
MARTAAGAVADFGVQHRIQEIRIVVGAVNLGMANHAISICPLAAVRYRMSGRCRMALETETAARLIQQPFGRTSVRRVTGHAASTIGSERADCFMIVQEGTTPIGMTFETSLALAMTPIGVGARELVTRPTGQSFLFQRMSRTAFKLTANTGVAFAAEFAAVIQQQTGRLAMHAVATDTRQTFGLVWVKSDLVQLHMRLMAIGTGGQDVRSAVSDRVGNVVHGGVVGMLVATTMTIGTLHGARIVGGARQRNRHVFMTIQADFCCCCASRQAASPGKQE